MVFFINVRSVINKKTNLHFFNGLSCTFSEGEKKITQNILVSIFFSIFLDVLARISLISCSGRKIEYRVCTPPCLTFGDTGRVNYFSDLGEGESNGNDCLTVMPTGLYLFPGFYVPCLVLLLGNIDPLILSKKLTDRGTYNPLFPRRRAKQGTWNSGFIGRTPS